MELKDKIDERNELCDKIIAMQKELKELTKQWREVCDEENESEE